MIAASILSRDLDMLPEDKDKLPETLKLRPYLSFDEILETIDSCSVEEIIGIVSEGLGIPPEALADYPYEYCTKGVERCTYSSVLADLKENIGHYDWVFDHLADNASRKVYTNLIYYRLLPVIDFINLAYDPKNPQFFDRDIIQTTPNEVFVDCGGYQGATTKSFLANFGQYKKIYIYEPSLENAKACRSNLAGCPNIDIRNACLGTGSHDAVVSITKGRRAKELPCGRKSCDKMNCVSLDEDIQEPVTFIKIDAKCATITGLKGASRHITVDRPKLAICAYHILSDIWEIPQAIHSICADYSFYIRHYGKNLIWETVIYAVPAV
jgi:FkbM family methyltransferase